MKMKLIVILSFVFIFHFSYGQADSWNISIDTLEIIEPHAINDENICYQIKDGFINFSKELTIQIWSDEIENWKKRIDSTPNTKEWEIVQFNKFINSLEYVKSMDTLIFLDPWKIDSIFHPKQIENNIQLLSAIKFHDIACTMLESGDFRLVLYEEEISKVIKAEVYEWDDYSGQRSIKYLADKNHEIWICPPIIHDAFVF